MSAYLLVFIWVASNFICFYISKRKKLQPGLLSRVGCVFLGPFAIPFVLASKPHEL
jgi:hypothetical protein